MEKQIQETEMKSMSTKEILAFKFILKHVKTYKHAKIEIDTRCTHRGRPKQNETNKTDLSKTDP